MTSAYGNLNGPGPQQVWINVTRTGQNVADNKSSYSAEVRYYSKGYTSWTDYTQNWNASFGGINFSGTFTIPYADRTKSYISLWTGTFTKTHNADGTLAAFACSATLTTNHETIGSGTVNITEPAPPTIPRASTPSFVGGSALTSGVAATINTNRASTSFTHEIKWAFGGLTNQTTGFSASTGIGTSVTFTPPHSMLAQIPNAAVGSGTITLTTKNGSTTIGTKTVAFTLTAASSLIPTISSITLAEQNATVTAQVGAYVQSLSVLKGTVNAEGVQGSTISDRKWSASGTTVASASNITIQSSGTVAIGAEATDSRGRKATYAQNITVLPYVAPKFNNVLVRRANSGGTVIDDGTYLRVDLNCLAQSLNTGTEKNSLSIKVFTRLYGTSTWTARNVINHSATSYNTNFLISGGAIFPVNQSFDVRVEINDKFNTSAAQTIVATATIFMHWSSTGVGIGKYHEVGKLDVDGDIYHKRDDTPSIIEPSGIIQIWPVVAPPAGWLICNGQAVSRTTYASLFAVLGTMYGAGNGTTTFNLPNLKGRVPVGYDTAQTEFDAMGETGGAKTHTLTVGEMPSHTHTQNSHNHTQNSHVHPAYDNYNFAMLEIGVNGVINTTARNMPSAGGETHYFMYASGGAGGFTEQRNTNPTTATNQATTATNQNTGGGGAHNNLQPYIALNYIIKI